MSDDWDRLEKGVEHRRAGGLSGFGETDAWWQAGGSCARAKVLLGQMTALERVSFFGDKEVGKWVMDAVDSEKADWARRDAEEIPKILEAAGKYPRKKTVKPYWMRTIEGLDMEKTGRERLLGDWVMDPASECDEGELVVVGLRHPEKRVALCRVRKGEVARLFTDVRPDIEIEGLTSIAETNDFGTFLDLVAKMGVPGMEKG
jgi:hypothetical protein